jgi:murein DD-endopeptidase MepM/ murein hydrolase activator NlpD
LHLLLAGTVALGIGTMGHRLHRVPTPTVDAAAVMPATAPAYVPAEVAAAAAPVTSSVSNAVSGLINKSVPSLQTAHDAVESALSAKPQTELRAVELQDDQTLSDLLTAAGINRAEALSAVDALHKVYDPRHLQSGQHLSLSITRTGTQEALNGIVFQTEATREVILARNAQGNFVAEARMVPVVRQHFAARGEIRSSLYESGARAGVPNAVMASLIHIYSHEIDFQRDVHAGDRFEILYEQPTTKNGVAVGEGAILYAALTIGSHAKPVYRVTFNDNTVDYFDERGQSVRRALLRTPVAAAHITSTFGMRINPILGYSKMHQGVDFGAPPGTPIFAAGAGTVVEIGPKGGYGRYIRLRHNGQLETAYAHMSAFAKNMYRGAHVNQGDVIGYVGSTGRSTGPHLHYEIHVANKPVNPLSVNLPTGRVLEGKLLAEFKKGQIKIQQEFASLSGNKNGFSLVNATAPAFGFKEAVSCGLRGGC